MSMQELPIGDHRQSETRCLVVQQSDLDRWSLGVPDNTAAESNNTTSSVDLSFFREHHHQHIRFPFLPRFRCLSDLDLSCFDGVESVGDGFLIGCSALKRVDLASLRKSLVTISSRFMAECTALESFDLCGFHLLRSIGGGFLESCSSLTSVRLENLSAVSSIGDQFLADCISIRRVDLSELEKLTSIGKDFMRGCAALESVSLCGLSALEFVGDSFLAQCRQLTDVDLQGLGRLANVGSGFMQDCVSLGHIDLTGLPNLKAIGKEFCSGCMMLTYVDTTNLQHLSSVGDEFLVGCSSLVGIDVAEWAEFGFVWSGFMRGCCSLLTLSTAKWSCVSSIWDDFLSLSTSLVKVDLSGLGDALAFLGKDFLAGCVSLTHVIFPQAPLRRLQSLGDGFMSDCVSLLEVDLTCCAFLTEVGQRCFAGCISLRRVDVSSWERVVRVGPFFLERCRSVAAVVVPPLPNCAVARCARLVKLVVSPSEVTLPLICAAINHDEARQYGDITPNLPVLPLPEKIALGSALSSPVTSPGRAHQRLNRDGEVDETRDKITFRMPYWTASSLWVNLRAALVEKTRDEKASFSLVLQHSGERVPGGLWWQMFSPNIGNLAVRVEPLIAEHEPADQLQQGEIITTTRARFAAGRVLLTLAETTAALPSTYLQLLSGGGCHASIRTIFGLVQPSQRVGPWDVIAESCGPSVAAFAAASRQNRRWIFQHLDTLLMDVALAVQFLRDAVLGLHQSSEKSAATGGEDVSQDARKRSWSLLCGVACDAVFLSRDGRWIVDPSKIIGRQVSSTVEVVDATPAVSPACSNSAEVILQADSAALDVLGMFVLELLSIAMGRDTDIQCRLLRSHGRDSQETIDSMIRHADEAERAAIENWELDIPASSRHQACLRAILAAYSAGLLKTVVAQSPMGRNLNKHNHAVSGKRVRRPADLLDIVSDTTDDEGEDGGSPTRSASGIADNAVREGSFAGMNKSLHATPRSTRSYFNTPRSARGSLAGGTNPSLAYDSLTELLVQHLMTQSTVPAELPPRGQSAADGRPAWCFPRLDLELLEPLGTSTKRWCATLRGVGLVSAFITSTVTDNDDDDDPEAAWFSLAHNLRRWILHWRSRHAHVLAVYGAVLGESMSGIRGPRQLTLVHELADMSLATAVDRWSETRVWPSNSELLDYATQLARGLYYLHSSSPIEDEEGGAHGKICSRNIFLVKSVIKLGPPLTETTQPGTSAGDQPWEFTRFGLITKRGDVYAFGQVIYLMFSGRAKEALGSADVPRDVQKLTRRCCSHDPSSRPSALDCLEALARCRV